VPSATHASTADTATTATTAGAAPVAKVTYVNASQTIPPPNPNATAPTPATLVTATCPAGTVVTGGGASVSNELDGFVNDTYASSKTAWSADFFNNGGFNNTDSISATVTAICATAASSAP
jgi:hypothetical protein